VLAVIDRVESVQVQQFGQLACIDAITLVVCESRDGVLSAWLDRAEGLIL
jgi:hypothetical protein